MVRLLMNDRQRGYGKVLDMVLNNYWKHRIDCKCALPGCYTVWISKGDLKRVRVGLDSRRHPLVKSV